MAASKSNNNAQNLKKAFSDFLAKVITRTDYPNCLETLFNACRNNGNNDIQNLINGKASIYQITDPLIILELIKDLEKLKGDVSPGKEYMGPYKNAPGRPAIKYYLVFLLKILYPKNSSEIMDLSEMRGIKYIRTAEALIKELESNISVISESEDEVVVSDSLSTNDVSPTSKTWENWPRQIILWGAPGTGKSYSIDEKIKTITGLKEENVIRVTFHPATDYASFVGSYKPVMDGDKIAYKFQPQSFLNAYEKAYINPNEPVFLIIEEINRGNCAHIFGDIFQLLDRDENYISKYAIIPHEDIKKWLNTTGIENKENLRLPSNLFIWATMNSSDQSLYKLDSAFQRRWKMFYTPINSEINDIYIRIDSHSTVKWKEFLDIINGKMYKECEDRRMGPFFINADETGEIKAKDFVGKVLHYLYRSVFGIYNIDMGASETLSYDSYFNARESIFDDKIINTVKLKDFFESIGCKLYTDSDKESESEETIAAVNNEINQEVKDMEEMTTDSEATLE